MNKDKKKILLLGSTGSVGKNVVNVVQQYPSEYEITGIVANENVEEIVIQYSLLHASLKYIVIFNEVLRVQLEERINIKARELNIENNVKISCGMDSILYLCMQFHDIVFVAIAGIIGLKPVIESIPHCSVLAIANKETIVCGGKFIMNLAKEYNTRIIPVDSEHNAIFQIFEVQNKNSIDSIVLTASGGPFWNKSIGEIEKINPKEALYNKNWKMGGKISVDSATMMNKCLEVVEAMHLFDLEYSKIKILVHPQSIIHGMVHYQDCSTLMVAAPHDMRVPILYALSYPYRRRLQQCVNIGMQEMNNMQFYAPDLKKFPLVELALNIIQSGNEGAIIAMNIANEFAVDLFLNGKLHFYNMHEYIWQIVRNFQYEKVISLEDLYILIQEVYNTCVKDNKINL